MNTRAQVLSLIAELFLSGVPDNVSASDIRQGLTAMVDREYQPSEIPVSVEGLIATNLQSALLELALVSGTMSATEIRNALQSLTTTSRLNKSAVYGGEFSLNRRGKGNVLDGSFQTGMTNVSKGDFWVYSDENQGGDSLMVGDWVLALRDAPVGFNYSDGVNWEVIHFGDTSITQVNVELKHLRLTPTLPSDTLRMTGINAEVINVVINKLTYMGKLDDGEFGNYDYVYRYVNMQGTDIVINEDLLGFQFQPGMVVDIMYKLNN